MNISWVNCCIHASGFAYTHAHMYIPLYWQCDPLYPLGQSQRGEDQKLVTHVPPFIHAGLQSTEPSELQCKYVYAIHGPRLLSGMLLMVRAHTLMF